MNFHTPSVNMGCDTETLVFLKNSAADLRKLGANWGFSEEEITRCIEEALSKTSKAHKTKLETSPKNVARKWWRYFLVAIKIIIYLFIGFLVLVAGVLTVTTVSETADKIVSQALQPYGYEMMRAVRIVSLPIHRFTNITAQYYNAECIIDNPYYLEPESDCRICKHFKKVKEINATAFEPQKFTAYVNTFKPALIKRSLDYNVTYSDLRQHYLNDPTSFDDMLSTFESTVPELTSVDNLFSEDWTDLMNTSTKLQIHWQTKSVKASASLRKLFPRPRYLPEKAEIMLEKHMLFDGRDTPTYELPSIGVPTQLYILASGRRRALVRPLSSCKKDCTAMLVFMEAGDSLLFHREMYRVFIAANQHGPSLGYLVPFVI